MSTRGSSGGSIAKTGATFVDTAVAKAEWLPRSSESGVGIDEVADEDQKPLSEGLDAQPGPEDLSHKRLELVLLLASGTRMSANFDSNVGEERIANGSKLSGEMEAFKEKMEA